MRRFATTLTASLLVSAGLVGCGSSTPAPAATANPGAAGTTPPRDPKINKPTKGKLNDGPVLKSGE